MNSEVKNCHIIISSGFPETDFFSKMLSEKLNLQFIRVGEVFRTLSKSEEGYKIKQYLEKGLLVPSKVVAEMIEARFINEKRNVLLQGFPKEAEEMSLLFQLLHRNQFQLSGIWYFKIRDIDHYVADLKESDDLYIQKFGINEGRIRSQAENSETVFKNLRGSGNLETICHLVMVDSRKHYSEKEVAQLLANEMESERK